MQSCNSLIHSYLPAKEQDTRRYPDNEHDEQRLLAFSRYGQPSGFVSETVVLQRPIAFSALTQREITAARPRLILTDFRSLPVEN